MGTADDFEFSEKITRKLVRDGLISRRITDDDLYFMGLLKRVWTDEWYVAQMCKRFRPEKRAVMLAFPDFNKIQLYILNSYLKLEPGDEVIVRLDEDEVRITTMKKRIERVQSHARRHLKPGVSIVDEFIAERREAARRERE